MLFTLEPLNLGITLVLVASGLFGLALLAVRVAPRLRPAKQKPHAPKLKLDLPENTDAILLIEAGGRVAYANELARAWFELLADQSPDLEQLARSTQPSETFLGLCATPGQAGFTIENTFVEGTSYYVPQNGDSAIFLTLKKPRLTSLGANGLENGVASINLLTRIGEKLNASLNLEETLQAIHKTVSGLVQAEFFEVTVWDEKEKVLHPYRFLPAGRGESQLKKEQTPHQINEGLAGQVAAQRVPLLINDLIQQEQGRAESDRERSVYRSYLGVPLTADGHLIGTLELKSKSTAAFSQDHLEILQMLSGQTAFALKNALDHHREQLRAKELAALAGLAEIGEALQDPQELYRRLIDNLAPLLQADILGLILYNEAHQSLEGQIPFLGLPDQFAKLYAAKITPNSPAEQIWMQGDALETEDAASDSRLDDLGISHLAQAAGMKNSIFMPLAYNGTRIGYLQASNKHSGLAFTSEDARLMENVAKQVTPLIENAILIQEARQRTKRAEAQRRIASLAGSSATLDEILKFSLQDLANLLEADAALIYLLDETKGEINLHEPSIIGIDRENLKTLKRVASGDPSSRSMTINTKAPAIIANDGKGAETETFYGQLSGQLEQMQAMLSVPLVVRDRGIGEILIGSQNQGAFKNSDLQSVITAATQLGSAIERATLYTQTDESLQRRVDQLTSLTRIGRELNTTIDLQYLLKQVYDEILLTTKADCGSIVLFEVDEDAPETTSVALWLGDEPEPLLTPLEFSVITSEEALLIDDFSASEHQASHADIHSALLAPIAYQGKVAGLIHLHGKQAGQFDKVALESTQALAVQAAIALGNAQRYQEQVQRSDLLNRRVNALGKLFEAAQSVHLDQPLEESLEAIAHGIQEATPFDLVVIYSHDKQKNLLKAISGAGLPLEILRQVRETSILWEKAEYMLLPEFKIRNSYYIPYQKRPSNAASLNPGALVQNAKEMPAVEEAQWEAGDTLLSPLMNAAGEPLGLISVDAPRDGRQPDDLAVETLEIFSNEAALLIESSQKLGQLQRDFKQVQAQVARAEETSAAAESHLSTMLHKDLEQTIAIQRLSERARRIRIGLDIAEIANQQPDRSSVLTSLGHQMLTQMHLDTALIAEQTASGPRLLHSLGAVPDAGRPEALLGQRNPLQHTLQSGEMLLVANIDETPDWQNTPLLASLNAKSFIALPIASNGAVEAAVLAVSNTASAPFTDEDRQIYELIGNQAAIALQNLELLTETQRRLREVNLLLEFSQQLGSLDPTEILRTLVQSSLRVMTNAHAGFVALWSEQQNKLVVAAAGGYTENSLITEIAYAKGEALPGQVFASGAALRVAEVDFARQYNLSPEQLLKYREATGGRVPVSSMLIPIQAGGETLGVINLDNFNTSAAFSQDDEALVSSLTQQTALTLENARLFQASEQRAKQLQSLTDVATTITSSLETNALIVSLLDQLAPILPFDTGTLWLREGERLTIKAASGFEDSEQRMGLSVAMEDSVLLKGMIETGEPIAVPNTHEDDRFPALSEHRYHSWLGMPLITKGEVVGVIALEKAEEDFYSLEDVQATKTFAGQAAVALENARLFEESLNRAHDLDERSQRLAQLNRVSTELSSSLDSDHLLAYTAEELSQATNASAVSVILFQEEGASLRFETPGDSSVSLPALLPDTPLFERMREMQGTVTSEDVLDDERFSGLLDLLARRQTKSMLALPLASGDKTDGLFLIHKDERHRFTPGEIELALTISNQAAVALQNARLFDETRRFTAELEQRVAERTEELAREGQFTRTALQISTELSSSLDLDQVLNRSLRRLNETTGAHQSSIILRRRGEENLYYRAGVGITESPPTGGRPSTIKASEGLAGWVIEHREQLVVPNLFEDERWLIGQPDHTLHKSAIGAPLIVGEDALGALLLYYGEEGHFSSDQLNLLQAAANQFAVAINNGELFQLIRDQAEDLGTMLRAQQVEASRSTAMLAGVADGVLVTDDSGAISLFNESAETILGLDSDQVVGKSIDEFTGLFGRAARSWMEAIQQWSHDPPSAKANESFSDQITLEDGKVVSVRLSPVSVRDEFLGTVSIFQDVTHEVEVDKLKSEFVATVSHELRTPMTPIKGYVDFLLMGGAGDLNEQQMNFMEIIKSNTDRLGILVNDLLDISRIEAGQVGLTFQLLDLREFAEEIVATTLRRAQVEGKPMNIELAAEKDVPLVEGDPERIRQIMSNLIDNAFNYTQEHGNIKVLIYKTRGEVQVEVEDSGIGIAPEEQEKVFERFYRGENPLVMATAGTGLGLPIVKQLVEMHKGKIWLESTGKSGEGSKFSFTLPAPKTEEQSNDE